MASRRPLVVVTGTVQELPSGDTVAGVPGASGASGVTTVDFGALPGTGHATVVITGQSGILAGSWVRAWIQAVATADHTADEHHAEDLTATAGGIVAGDGFTASVRCNTATYGLWTLGWQWG